jgi:transcription initiation factor IIE alpha subunit
MEDDVKRLLTHLYIHQREDFGTIYRLLYQWKIDTAMAKGFIQLTHGNQLSLEDTQEMWQELKIRIERLDESLGTCLSISNSLPAE